MAKTKTGKQSFNVQVKAPVNIYTAMLGVSVICLTIGILALAAEWSKYGFERKPAATAGR